MSDKFSHENEENPFARKKGAYCVYYVKIKVKKIEDREKKVVRCFWGVIMDLFLIFCTTLKKNGGVSFF